MQNTRVGVGSQRLATLLACALLAASCGTIETHWDAYQHMLCVDAEGGHAPMVITDSEVEHEQGHEEHVKEIVKAYRAWSREQQNPRIMLVIHGGMVPMSTAVADVAAALPKMREDMAAGEVDPFFPVFINWETDLFASYGDHLLSVRQGERMPVTAWLTSPFFLVADIGRALVRYPITLFRQSVAARNYYTRQNVEPVPCEWLGPVVLDPLNPNAQSWCWTDALLDTVPGAAKLVTAPLLDGLGLPAFGNMQRRARVLLIRDSDFAQAKASGAVSLLMEALAADQQKHASGRPVEFTIVAHSMGAIVANQMIRRFGHRELPEPLAHEHHVFEFRDIVFMGAACTIEDFIQTTLHYVFEHPKTDFYNLCLHPRDEEDDRYGYGLLPNGSLLEWIDDFITEQKSEMDRTLGKWNNVARVLGLLDFLSLGQSRRVHLRRFGRNDSGPRDHGDFNDVAQSYWLRSFWGAEK